MTCSTNLPATSFNPSAWKENVIRADDVRAEQKIFCHYHGGCGNLGRLRSQRSLPSEDDLRRKNENLFDNKCILCEEATENHIRYGDG